MTAQKLPKLITFDGEARSGKGTIAQLAKDYLRDELGLNVMLIDRGQAFRALVVAASKKGINLDNPDEIDAFLADEANLAYCTQFVKDVYHMSKEERDSLLYTNEVGENSAKIGGRPASQAFVVTLTKKWMKSAAEDAYDAVLMDGRALNNIANDMDSEGLCEYVVGLYFICDPVIGARRTLGYAATEYDALTAEQRAEVDAFVEQIKKRNLADMQREVERLVRPQNAAMVILPAILPSEHQTYLIDTSAKMTKEEMSQPIAELIAQRLGK